MKLRDTTAPVALKLPATVTTSGVSSFVDRYGWDSVAFDIALAAATGLDGSNRLTLSVEGCDSLDDTPETVAATTLDESLPDIDSNAETGKVLRTEYTGTARYLRVRWVVTGTVSIGLAVTAMLGGPQGKLYGRPSVGL